MLRAGVGISTAQDPTQAGNEAAGAALEAAGLERADAALLFATPEHGAELPRLVQAAGAALRTRALAGGTASAVLGAGREEGSGPAVTLLALGGLEARAFLLGDVEGAEESLGAEIVARLGGPPDAGDLVVVLPASEALVPTPFLGGLERGLAPAAIVGAPAVPASEDQPLLWCGRECAHGGVAGLVLRTAKPPRVAVTQSCRLVTGPLTVTRAEGHWLAELEGRPALDVYREVARAPLASDLRRAASVQLVAVERRRAGEAGWVVRNVVGFADGPRAFAVAEPVRRGERVAFVLRDADGAREDLKRTLDGLAQPRPTCGLYFSCSTRGAALFGFSGLEAAYLEQAFGGAPVAGMFSSCEIGPLGQRTELLTYTAVLALLDG